ncbi:IS5/IS1182 family transposase, partial [Limosilactobacillus reuteri]|nr:IS5/IS1182 family transposase [Limosilactobacillus reuteri]
TVEKYHAKLREKTSKLYEELVEKQVVQEMAPELVTSAECMEVMEQELAEKMTNLDEDIKQEPKIIKGGSVRKRRRRFLKKLRHQLINDLIPRAKKYERAEDIFQGRNSYSKTDHDATFMCMKE